MVSSYTKEQLIELYELLKGVTVYPDTLSAFHWSTLHVNIKDTGFCPEAFTHWLTGTGKQLFPRYYEWLVGISMEDLPKRLHAKNPAIKVIIEWRLRHG